MCVDDQVFDLNKRKEYKKRLLLKPGPGPWTRTLDPDPGPWTRTLDPGPYTRTLDPGPGPWTLENLDPEKHGKQLDMEK